MASTSWDGQLSRLGAGVSVPRVYASPSVTTRTGSATWASRAERSSTAAVEAAGEVVSGEGEAFGDGVEDPASAHPASDSAATNDQATNLLTLAGRIARLGAHPVL